MTTSDPTRSPAGTESLWAYTHVPQRVRDDAGGRLTGDWDRDDADRFADRMQTWRRRTPPASAPGCWPVGFFPRWSLERRDANLVGGSVGGGSRRWTSS